MSRNELEQGLLQTGGSSTITQNFNNHLPAVTPRLSLLEALQFSELGYREHTVEAAQDETCTWLLDTREYYDWIASGQSSSDEHRLLWIKAKAGAGKSTLMRFAIKQAHQDAEDPSSSEEAEPTPKRRATTDDHNKQKEANPITRSPNIILSHFFNARGNDMEKSTEGLYRTLLVQLMQQLPYLSSALSRINNGWQPIQGKSWPIANLTDLLRCAVGRLDRAVVLFVDALDECNEDEVRTIIHVFRSLITKSVSSQQSLRVCFASRPWPDIGADKAVYINLSDHEAHHRDIQHYINTHLRIGTGPQADNIRSRISENSRGVFLWVKLVVALLNKEYDWGRLENLERRLQGTHGDLEALYLEMLDRYKDSEDDSDNRIQTLCFQWVLSATRTLVPIELWWGIQLGLGLDFNAIRERERETDLPAMVRYISSASKGLVECIIPPSRFDRSSVRFIHESARQFVVSNRGPLSQEGSHSDGHIMVDAYTRLKQCCYQLLQQVWPQFAGMDTINPDEPRFRLPLFQYAARNTLKYAEMLQVHGVEQRQWLADRQNQNDDFNKFLWPSAAGNFYRPASLLNVIVQYRLDTLLTANWLLFLEDTRAARKQQHLPGFQDGQVIGSFVWIAYSSYQRSFSMISYVLDLYMELELLHDSAQDLLRRFRATWAANTRRGGSSGGRTTFGHRRRYTLSKLADWSDELATFILIAATPIGVSFNGDGFSFPEVSSLKGFADVSRHILQLGLPNDYFDTARGCHDDMVNWAERRGHEDLVTTLRDTSIRARFGKL